MTADTNPQTGDAAQDSSSLATEGEKSARCGREKADGTTCKAWRVKGRDACAGHLGLGIGSDPAGYAKQAATASAIARSDRAAARKIGTLEAIRALLEDEKTLQALTRARDSDDPSVALRAVQLMLDRVHGKPKETVQTVETPAELQAVRDMSREEREELWRRLVAAEEGLAT